MGGFLSARLPVTPQAHRKRRGGMRGVGVYGSLFAILLFCGMLYQAVMYMLVVERAAEQRAEATPFTVRCQARREDFRARNPHLFPPKGAERPALQEGAAPPLDIDKTVKYLPSEYPVESFIRSAFRDEGFSEVRDSAAATFVIGKASAQIINWQVCRGVSKHNHIPGQRSIVTKDGLTGSLATADRLGSPVSRMTHIVSSVFYKKSYATAKPQDCDAWMQEVDALDFDLNPQELNRPQYIRKALRGGHNGKGLSILTGSDVKRELKRYRETHACPGGQVLVQQFLRTPYLVEGRTFNLRLFMVVLRTKPALAAYYEGYLRLTKSKYDVDSKSSRAFISNSEKVWGKAGRDGGSGGALKHFWMLPELCRYMQKQGDLPEAYRQREDGASAYLDEVLRPRIMGVFSHIFRVAQKSLSSDPQYFGVYGADMTLEAGSLRPYVFEVNYSPELSRFVPLGAVQNMYSDTVTAQLALLRNQTTPWDALASELRAPERFHILADDQKGFTFSRPDLFE